MLGRFTEIKESSPLSIFQKYIEEATKMLRGEAKSKELKQENEKEQLSQKGWYASLWRRS